MNRLFARAGLWSAAAVQCSFFRSRSPRVAFVLQLASGKERKRERGKRVEMVNIKETVN